MRSARLELALQSGVLVLPASGEIVVWRPRAGDDLTMLPKAQVVVKTGFKPDHDYFATKGFAMTCTSDVALAIVCLPRAKAEARAVLAQAASGLAADGYIAIDGQKTDGVDAILKECRALGLDVGEVLAKAHGKFALVAPKPALQGWTAQAQVIDGGFQTMPGVFSADGADRGSVLLAAALPPKLPSRVADLGAGWGYLSRAVLQRSGVKELDLIEADAAALDCAKTNVTDPRARFHWADATTFKPARLWDAVVMNPPFHTSRDADPALGAAFIHAAQRALTPAGCLWMVANRHLPYDRVLTALFREIEDIGGDGAFRVIRAAYPVRTR